MCASISKRPDLRPLAALLDEKGDEIFRDADSIALEIDMDKELVKRVFAYARKYGKAVYAVVSNMSIAVERRDFLQQTSCFVCNLQEAGILFSDDYSEKTPAEMEELLRLKVRSARIPRMIVTMGEQGAVYAEMDGESGICPAPGWRCRTPPGPGMPFSPGPPSASPTARRWVSPAPSAAGWQPPSSAPAATSAPGSCRRSSSWTSP